MDTIYISNLLETSCHSYIEKIVANDQSVEKEKKDIISKQLKESLVRVFKLFCQDRAEIFNMSAKADKCFVICFTDRGDSRFLWEAYSNNTGVNIQFKLEDIKAYLNENRLESFSYYRFNKVVYDEKEQLKMINRVLKKSYEIFYNHSDSSLSDIIVGFPSVELNFEGNATKAIFPSGLSFQLKNNFVNFIRNTCLELLKLAPLIKHPYWKEEKEYRLVFYRPFGGMGLSNLSFHTDNNMYYIEIPFKKELFQQVRISPCSKFNETIFEAPDYLFSIKHSIGKGVLYNKT
jgi:hypothetical protein